MYLPPVCDGKIGLTPCICGAGIRLPYPNPPSTEANPPNWPADGWQLRDYLPRVRATGIYYEKQSVQGLVTRPLEEETRFDFIRAELEALNWFQHPRSRWHVPTTARCLKASARVRAAG